MGIRRKFKKLVKKIQAYSLMQKRHFVIIFLLAIICKSAHGQNRILTDDELNNSTVVKMNFADTIRNCDAMDKWFNHDVKNNTIFLFLQSGIAPVVYTKDKDFENKYKVYLEDFLCTAPDYKCVIRYNNDVFKYLTSIYGEKWIKQLRKDVIGFKEWKQQH
jgi:hypothetical protein